MWRIIRLFDVTEPKMYTLSVMEVPSARPTSKES